MAIPKGLAPNLTCCPIRLLALARRLSDKGISLRRAGSHEVAGNSYAFIKNTQMASTGVIWTSTYHTK